MQDNEKKSFSAFLTGMAELYGRELSQVVIGLYWGVLKQFSLGEIQKAGNQLLAERKYSTFPLPADFYQIIHPAEDLALQAAKATKELLYRMENRYVSFRFNDPYIAEVVDLKGGWQRVCESFPEDVEDQRFWLKDFEKLYASVVKSMGSAMPEARRIIGLLEAQNAEKGYITDDKGRPIQGESGFIRIGSEEAKKYFPGQQPKSRQIGAKSIGELLSEENSQ